LENSRNNTWAATWNARGKAQLEVIPNNQSNSPRTSFNNISHIQAFLEVSQEVGWECQFSYNDEANLRASGTQTFEECRLLCSDLKYEAFQFNDADGEVQRDVTSKCSCVKDVRQAAWPCLKRLRTLVCSTNRHARPPIQKVNAVQDLQEDASRKVASSQPGNLMILPSQAIKSKQRQDEDVGSARDDLESRTLTELAAMITREIEAIRQRRESAPEMHSPKIVKSAQGSSGVMRGIYSTINGWTYLLHIDKKDFASESGVVSWMLMFAPLSWTEKGNSSISEETLTKRKLDLKKHSIARETLKGYWASPTVFEGVGQTVSGDQEFAGKSGKVKITFDDSGCTFVSVGDRCNMNDPKKSSECVARLDTLDAMDSDAPGQLMQGISYQRDWTLSVTLKNDDFRATNGSPVKSSIKYTILKAPRFQGGKSTAEDKIVGKMQGDHVWGNYFDLKGGLLPLQFNVVGHDVTNDVTCRIKCYDPRERDFCSVSIFKEQYGEKWETPMYQKSLFLWPLYPSWDTARALTK
jgi:hypothetical protein